MSIPHFMQKWLSTSDPQVGQILALRIICFTGSVIVGCVTPTGFTGGIIIGGFSTIGFTGWVMIGGFSTAGFVGSMATCCFSTVGSQ